MARAYIAGMTLSAAPPLHPVGLADLDAARADWERSARRGRWFDGGVTLWMTLLFAGLTLTGVWGPLGGTVMTLLFPFTRVVVALLQRFFDHRVGGPAAPGPSSMTTVRSSSPGPELWSAVSRGLSEAGFSSRWLLDAHTLNATRTWGFGVRQFLTVRCVPAEGGGALVTVWSRPDVGWWHTSTPEYGRARRYANAVLRAIPGVHEVVREPQDPSKTGSIR